MFLVSSELGRDTLLEKELDVEEPLLLAVADGMGGHAGGEVASQICCEMLRDTIGSAEFPEQADKHDAFIPLVMVIHDRIQNAAGQSEGTDRMGTTIVGCCFYPDGRLSYFHAGDSRLYRHGEEVLWQLTRDHTVKEELARMGANPSGFGGHMVTSCLGGGMDVPVVDTATLEDPLAPGDKFLLCSDGLSDMVTDKKIESILKEHSASEAGQELIKAAHDNGGVDNITVLVIEVI